ncbi:MAG: FAD:protein FMN transferase, partial [Bacteroidales bacterium]
IMTAMPVLLLSSCKSNDSYLTINDYAQGGTFKVTYSMPSSGKQSVKALEDSIKSELALIDDTFSGYNKGSEITKVNEAGSDTVEVNATFAELFGRSKTIWEESSGAFDPSGAPIFDLWGFGFSNKGKVTQHQIDSLKQFVGMDKIRIDIIGGRFYIIKSDPRIKLNFNAIAQGYTCDCIARILDSFGVENYLVDLGEIVCKGVNGKGVKWIIGVEHPEDGNQTKGKAIQTTVSVTNCGIVTSGNYRKFYIENGKKYAHTIDPRTGYPAQQSLLSATAICKDGTTADAYATWFMVIGTDSSKAVLSRMPDTKAVLIYDEDGTMKVWSNVE